MSHFAVAGLQLELSGQDNLYLIQKEIEKTIGRFPWLDMVVLSELATYGPSTQYAQTTAGEAERLYCEIARQHNIWLIPGSLFEKREGKIFNTAPVISPDGEVVQRYRKMFPFFRYEKGVTPGEKFVVFDVPEIGRVGVIICYDLWFPETIRSLVAEGAELIVCPTLTNTIDRDVEVAMTRAHAASNQCFLVNINAAGTLGVGRSVIAGPDGSVIHEAGVGREIIAVEVDFNVVRRVRERGIHNLGQVLKSFRDSAVSFDVYASDHRRQGYLGSLGRLQVPGTEVPRKG